MRKPKFTIWTVLIFLCTFAAGASAQYSGGSGTASDPYQISTVADWQTLMNTSADWDKHFILTADLDLQAVALSPVGVSYNQPFRGVFDGKGHVIRNTVIDIPEDDYVSLFGCMGWNAHIQDLGVENIAITGKRYVGGLVGFNLSGTITRCYATGTVNGEESVGGLVGYNSGNLASSYTAGAAIASGDNVGGLVGDNSGEITACYSIGSASGYSCVGGLMGINWGTATACYATGTVSGDQSLGGLVGNNCGEITTCYSIGSVCGNLLVGGLVGNNWGNVTTCFWDVATSGQAGSSGGKGLSTNQMKSMTIYRNAGWAVNGWVINDGNDYPHLAWENIGGIPIPDPEPVPLLGNGTTEDPYQIWNAEDFALLSWHTAILDKHIAVMTDIDMFGTTLYPIGDLGRFVGAFNGNGHIIRSVVIQQPSSDYVGLFAYLGENGQIHNIHVEQASITGRFYVGGLVGYNSGGSLSACHAACSVNGDEIVGALVGENDSDGNLYDCYTIHSVKGNYDVGGLVGVNCGTITACGTNGSTNGRDDIGGLVGYNDGGNLLACYAAGTIDGNDCVGGLVGWNYFGTLTECYTIVSVIASGDHIGGLTGENYHGSLSTCCGTGTIDGSDYVGGLVGYNLRGTVTYCHSTGTVKGRGELGGLVGCEFGGRVSFCNSSATVNGSFGIGGLVGSIHGSLIECFATGSVSGDHDIGGLAGDNSGNISCCYAIGSVKGNRYVGGLVGYNWSEANINTCYSTGPVNGKIDYVGGLVGKNYYGIINTSFWDILTSGHTTSAGGSRKTTTEMKTKSTFTETGWDFAGETVNGTEDTWSICEGTNYPRLTWQIPEADWLCPDGVGMEDFGYLAEAWLIAEAEGNPVDLDNDNFIGVRDLMIFCEQWLTGRQSEQASIYTPTR